MSVFTILSLSLLIWYSEGVAVLSFKRYDILIHVCVSRSLLHSTVLDLSMHGLNLANSKFVACVYIYSDKQFFVITLLS